MNQPDLDQISNHFESIGTAERAAGGKAYLKSDLEFFGVHVPDIRTAVRGVRKVHPDVERKVLLDISLECFEKPHFEMRLFGVLLLERYVSVLEPEDLRHLERLVRMCETWALVDPIAKPLGAALVDRGMPDVGEILDEWSVDSNFWIRRCSMLSLIPGLVRDDAYWDRFVGYADSMIEEREFFIRKVIGWALREVSKVRPTPVAEFVERHMPVISGVTFREAVKYLPEPQQTELLTAYKSR